MSELNKKADEVVHHPAEGGKDVEAVVEGGAAAGGNDGGADGGGGDGGGE